MQPGEHDEEDMEMIEGVLQPYLQDHVVSLRPLQAADWRPLYAIASDPSIWEAHPAHDRWRQPVFRRFFEQGLASGGALTIMDAASGAIIGTSRFDRRRVRSGEVEIGWTMLARNRWGGRTNAAVKRLMIAHALQSFEAAVFIVGEQNLRSRRAMEKIGGMLTDQIAVFQMAGLPVRHVVYSIDRAAFEAGPLSLSPLGLRPTRSISLDTTGKPSLPWSAP